MGRMRSTVLLILLCVTAATQGGCQALREFEEWVEQQQVQPAPPAEETP